MKKSKLRRIAEKAIPKEALGVTSLLLKDHRAMRKLMEAIKSPRSTREKAFRNFKKLEKIVRSHVKAEETSLLKRIYEHPKFEDEAMEGIEEHRIHEDIIQKLHRFSDKEKRLTRMKIFCEFLEHHLDEEEEDLFPLFNKLVALSTRKKIGTIFMKRRKETRKRGEKLGAMRST